MGSWYAAPRAWLWVLVLGRAPSARSQSCPSITQAVETGIPPELQAVESPPDGDDEVEADGDDDDDRRSRRRRRLEELTSQRMWDIPSTTWHSTRSRRLPFAPPSYMSDRHLRWEYAETRDFLEKQLSEDPRLQPDDVIVTTDHMNMCVSCVNYDANHEVLNPAQEVIRDVALERQLFVDDWSARPTPISCLIGTPRVPAPSSDAASHELSRMAWRAGSSTSGSTSCGS